MPCVPTQGRLTFSESVRDTLVLMMSVRLGFNADARLSVAGPLPAASQVSERPVPALKVVVKNAVVVSPRISEPSVIGN